MMAYREIAMRHGDRWLARKRTGMMQELRKGKGDAAGLEAKLAILLEVLGERTRLAAKAVEKMEELKGRREKLDGERKEVKRQMREATLGLAGKKRLIEKQMEGLGAEMEALASAVERLEDVKKNGLAGSPFMKDIWERQLG